MKAIGELFGKWQDVQLLPTMQQRTREWYIQQFYENIKPTWDNRYGKLYPSRIKFKTSHLTKKDMEWLYNECRESKHFAKCFFGCLKVKDDSSAPSAGNGANRCTA
jgi:hypothetical protein